MKIKLKNRIVSALLAFAMVLSLVPAGLIPEAEAITVTNATLDIKANGEFTATFFGSAPDGWGDMYFVLLPDIRSATGAKTVTEAMEGSGALLTAARNSLANFKTNLTTATGITWDDDACFDLDTTEMADGINGVTITTSYVEVKGTIPTGVLDEIYPDHVKKNGSLRYTAFLRSSQEPIGAGHAEAPYSPSGIQGPLVYYINYAGDGWIVNGEDKGTWRPGDGSAYIEVPLKNLGGTQINLTGINYVSSDIEIDLDGEIYTPDVLWMDQETGDFPAAGYFTIDGNEITGTPIPGTQTKNLVIEIGSTSMLDFAVEGTINFNLNYMITGQTGQKTIPITCILTTVRSYWTYNGSTDETGPLDLVSNVKVPYTPAGGAVSGTLVWHGTESTINALVTNLSNGTLTYSRGGVQLKVGDTISDGDVVTVRFEPVAGRQGGTYGPYPASISANNIAANVNTTLNVTAEGDTTVTVYKDGVAWNNPGNGIATLELDDGSNTYAGTWTNNVWKATGVLNTGTYDVMVNNAKVGSMDVTYGQSKNFDLNYYTVTVKTNGSGGSAWIGAADATDKTTTNVTVLSGGNATISAEAKPGYRFTGWTGTAALSGTTEDITNITSGPNTYTANFEVIGLQWQNGHNPAQNTTTWTIGTTAPTWTKIIAEQVGATGDIGDITYKVTGTVPGLEITATENDGVTITGTPTTAAGSPFTITVKASAANGQYVEEQFKITVNKQALPKPTGTGKNPSVNNASDGEITWTNRDKYPSGTVATLKKSDGTPIGTWNDGASKWTGLPAGDYYIEVTNPDPDKYTLTDPRADITLTNPAANDPTIKDNRTYERNKTERGANATYSYSVTTGNWDGIGAVSVGSGSSWVSLPAAAWSYASNVLTLDANELDKVAGLLPGTLANGSYSLKATFTDSKGLQANKDIEGGTLNVKTTYVLNYNAGTGVTDASLPATVKTPVASGNAAASFAYASATRPGYTLVGWSTNGEDTNAEWKSGNWTPAVTAMNSTVYAVWDAVAPSGATKDFTGTVGTAFTPDFEVIPIKVSNKPNATFSYTHGSGTTGLPDLSAYGLTLKEDDKTPGRIIITATTPTHATANEGWVSFSFKATEQESGASTEFTFRVRVYKQTLTAPTLAWKANPSAAGTATGAITMTVPSYPTGAGPITYTLDGPSTPAVTGAGDITGLLAGTYKVKATLNNTNDYKWATPITGETQSTWSNTVDLEDPGINRPTVANSQTFEKNTAVTGRTTSFAFTFNTKDWTTVDGVQIGSHTLTANATTGYTVNYDAGTASATTNRTGTITVPVAVLDALDPQLANGNATVTVTFGRTGGTEDTRTDTATCTLKVQTTYIVSFADYNGSALSPVVPSVSKTTTNTTVPTFTYTSPSSTPVKDGYLYAGWTTEQKATPSTGPADWFSTTGKTNYTPSTNVTNKSDWNTTVYATWTANVVTITVYKNGEPNTDKEFVLVKDGKVISNGVRGGAGNNVITFSAVPTGEYSIELGDATSHTPTGHKVTAAAGATRNHDLHYYDVKVVAPVVTGTSTPVGGGSSYIKTTGTTTVELLTEGTNDNAIIRASITDPNYDFKVWSQKPTGGTLSGNATNGTFKLTAKSTSVKGPIVLTPEYQKSRYDVKVIVKRNGELQPGQTVTWAGVDQTPVTDSNGEMTIHGVSNSATPYAAGVKGWTGTKNVTVNGADQTVTLEYYDYYFDANKPDEATGSVDMKGTTDPTAPVLTGHKVTQPVSPELSGYTFQGWATSKAGPAATWSTINTITAEKTFYAIWTPNTVKLDNMTAYGALNVVGIRGFTAEKGSGTGHNADNDFTYEVWDGSKWANTATQDGITLNAGSTLTFAPASAPTKVGTATTPVTTSVFRVRAVSKLNGQVSAATSANATTVTVTIQPTYKVQYDKNTGGNDGSVPGSVPTDSNLYVVTATGQDFAGATGSGGETVIANTITASSARLTWTGNVRTQSGWASSSTGAVASNFQASTVANAQKIAPGGTLTLYAIWIGKDLTVNSQKLDADYNMNADQWLASSYYTAGQTPDINLTGLYLPDIVSNGTNANNLTFNVTDIPAFMEYDSESKTLKLKDNTRVGNAGTYTITVEVTDSGNSNAKATGTVTLEVHKTTPVIDGFKIDPSSTRPYYVGDVVWPETTYVDVHDPYEPTKKLSTPTDNPTATRWADTTQTFKSGTNTYSYTYSPADTTNYNTPAPVSVTFEAAVRTIALQVQDDDKNAAWSSTYTNSNTPTYDPDESWKKVTVKIRNPESSNSPVEKLTWSQTAGAGDSTFRNIKIVEADGSTDRTSPSSLAVGKDGEIILTFEVNIHASGSHTLTFKFDGVAGDGLPSKKTATATYTYTTVAQANKLATPDPDLTRVEVNDGIEHPDGSNDDSTIDYTKEEFKDQDGNVIDEKLGGLHLIFKPITQDTRKDEAANPVDHYVVTLTGEKVNANTPNSITIRPDELDADGYYHYYWKADLTNGPVPGKDYVVEVQAFSRNTALYQNSDKGDDQVTSAGYRELTVDMLTTASFTDKTFNGRPQTGGTISAITGSGTPQMFYADKSGETAVANKTSVNMTETPTDPGLTSNPIHDYYIYVYVPQGTLYLALGTPTAPVAYTASKTTKGTTRSTRTGTNHPNWEIVQAQASMSLAKSTFNGQTMTPADIRPTPTVRYTTGTGTGNAMYNNGVVTGYYDIVYTVTGAPAGSTYTAGQVLTETQLQTFMADKAGTYSFKAEAKYKTGDDRNIQFEADVSEAMNTFTFKTGDRVVDHIVLERYEAVNGTTGVTGVDTGANLTDKRAVTYGDAVDVNTWTGIGYYNADNAATAKQMRLEGLRITVHWSGGEPDVYIVGTDTLPSDAVWTSSNTGVANSPAITDSVLTFKGASVSTNLSFSYGGKTSNNVTYTMDRRPIDYTVVSDVERVWSNGSSKVTGHIEFDLPDNLNGDNVAIAVNGDQFQTTNMKYDAWVAAGSTPYNADDGYTANGDVGKDKLVRAVNAGTSGSGADVSGADKAFYKTGKETPGKASIIPRLVNTITLTTNGVEPGKKIVDATVTVVLNDGEGNRGLEQSNPIRYSSGKIKWQILKDGGDPENEADWEEPTDETFLSNRKYRPTITVQANTNHYLELSDKYTLNGFHNGQRTDDDNQYLTTVTVESDNPYHPDWLPDREVLYHNIAVFQGILDLTVTPELQFADFRSSDYDFENYDADKAHHKFQANTVHIESVSVGESLGKYNIDLRADVLSVWDVSVAKPNGNLLDMGGILTPLTDTKVEGEMRYREKEDMIRYELDLTGVSTDTPGEYILTLSAKGSAKEGTKANDIQASYTFALVVSKAAPEPTPMPVESIIVLYWVSLKGKTNDLTGEKIPASGGRPTFVPKIIGLDGWVFKGWSETDPTLLKDGEKPTLVDPLKISLTSDKIYYAYYEKEEVDHIHFVRGYPDGTFRPDNYITRAEVATIIARSCLEGFEEGHDYGNPGGYSDIGTKRWYTSAVSYCSMAGVFAGYPDGTFRPNDYITRQELALVVGRLAGLRVNMGLPFEDADTVNKWARDGVYTCYILGYVDGYKDGTFRPKNDITRAETVKIFNGYLNRGVDAKGLEGMTPFQLDASAGSYQINGTTEYLTWEDVPEKHWAYYEIIEASNDHDFHWPEDENNTSKKDAPPEDWDAVYIEAEWRYRTTYAITWSVSEGTVAETTTKVALNKTPVAPEVTADEGRVFLGWALTEGGEVVDLTTIVITGAQTFYGIFADDENLNGPKTFTVSFETGEWADLDGESSISVEENGVLTTVPAAIAHEGYLFLGWSLTIGGEVIDPTTVIVTEDMSFFAVCEEKPAEPKSLTVTFLSGEHGYLTGEPIVTVEEGSALTELPVVTAQEGYDFRGWSRTEGGAAVDPTQLILMEDTLFYALYEEQVPTIPEIPGTLYTVKAYIDGYEDGTFRPKEHITRATVASMIARAYGSDFDESFDYDLSAVSDITPDHWAAKEIGYCLEKGYFSGYPDGTFAPDGTMTRQEFAVVIAKLAGVQENQGLPFTDADSINKWARNYVYTVYVNGWIMGYNDGTFKPKNLITRAEAVKIFNAFLGRSTTKESFDQVTEFDHVWSDFSSRNWAYPDIMEATNDHTYYLNEDGVAIWVDPSVVEALTSGETETSEGDQNPEELQMPEEG